MFRVLGNIAARGIQTPLIIGNYVLSILHIYVYIYIYTWKDTDLLFL
jgi:hypothetical protein